MNCMHPWITFGVHFSWRDILRIKAELIQKDFRLAVPNREIRNIITEQVLALFKQNVEKDGQRTVILNVRLMLEVKLISRKM